MEKTIDAQIAEVKNNIRYYCNKYKWENYETSYHHKHHHHHRHSKQSKKVNKKDQTPKCKHIQANSTKQHKKFTKNEVITQKIINQNNEVVNQKQDEVGQKEEFDLTNVQNEKSDNSYDKKEKEDKNIILAEQNKEKGNNDKIDIKNPEILVNEDTCNQICLLSSDEDSDSSFDFNEFQNFFKAQDDLYHLTKHVKQEKSKKAKPKAIILYSDSDSDLFNSDSSFDLDDYRFTKNMDRQKHDDTINHCSIPTQTKDQSTNTIHKEYSSTDTQTTYTGSRIPSNNKKIKFSAQLKANVRRSFNSLMHSSSSSGSKSYSNSNSSNYSSSRGSYENSAQKLNSTKALSEQYASSENESSRGSNKILSNPQKNNNNLSSSNSSKKSLNESKKVDDLNTNKLTKIENALEIIEEEEEASDDIENRKSTIHNTGEAKTVNGNLRENQTANKEIQAMNQKNNSNNNNNLSEYLNQDVDIEKLIEEVSQNSSKIKQTVKKSKKIKKNPSSLKIGSAETDENTEAYSQIPSEFSDNIGVDSSLGFKQPEPNDQVQKNKISHAKTTSKILKLEDFMEQSDNIHISSKLENEYEEPKKNYNNYGSSSESVIDAPS